MTILRLLATLSILLLPLAAIAKPPAPPAHAAIERRLATVTQQSLADAIAEASRYIAAHRGASVTIRLPTGKFDLARGQTGRALIDVSQIDACPGVLTIAGAGHERTTLIRDSDKKGIFGRKASCITFADIALMQRRIEVSQGRVVSVGPQTLVLDVPPGFPTPAQLIAVMPSTEEGGIVRRWLRRFILTPTGPQVDQAQRQMRWLAADRVVGAPSRWRLSLGPKADASTLRPGDMIALKAKSGGQAYRFLGGRRITFRGIQWVNDARGLIRDVNELTIENCVVLPHAPIGGMPFFLSTSGGGPQIGRATRPPTSGDLIQNNVFIRTGDDALALRRVSGLVRGNRISDPFGRGIVLLESPDAKLVGNVLTRAPILNKAVRGNKQLRRQQRRQGKM